jgi:hypothetical protein
LGLNRNSTDTQIIRLFDCRQGRDAYCGDQWKTLAKEDAMTEIEVTLPTTMPLRKFAKIAFGVSENTAYSRQEEIPTMRLGNLLLVAPRVALAKMAGDDAEVLRLMTRDFAASLKQFDEPNARCKSKPPAAT